MTEQEKWERANNIFTLITQRDDSDSWRAAVMQHLTEAYDAGYDEGFQDGQETGYTNGHEIGYEHGYSQGYDNAADSYGRTDVSF